MLQPSDRQQLQASLQHIQNQLENLKQHMNAQISDLQRQITDLQIQLDRPTQPTTPPSVTTRVTTTATASAMATPTRTTVTTHRATYQSSGPIVLMADRSQPPDLLPNGIDAVTGQPLLAIDSGAAAELARQEQEPDHLRELHTAKERQSEALDYGPVYGINEDRLDEARWAIVVNSQDDAALLYRLTPLIVWRSQQQGITLPPLTFRIGETCGEWLQRHVPDPTTPWDRRPPVLLHHPGESCTEWLQRHGVAHGPVDPQRGIPFYVLLVGRPGPSPVSNAVYISFHFQYELDMFWGVGRLCFHDAQGNHQLEAYAAYAEQLVAFEQSPPPLHKHAVFFGPKHELDLSTERSATELIPPLANGIDNSGGVVAHAGFSQQTLLERAATRTNLDAILRGATDQGPPSLLFSATHGVAFPADDPRLPLQQGALLCQEWTGIGSMERHHWYAAEDLSPQAQVRGLVAILFACYGVGCPQEDEFIFTSTPGRPAQRPIIAPYPLIAQLPQRLLQQGALAVLGHVERAWTFSFSAPGVPAQSQPFEDLLARVLDGKRLGFATDQFNLRQGVLSSLLAERLERSDVARLPARLLSALWVARNDARNYALLGDPAARLPIEQM